MKTIHHIHKVSPGLGLTVLGVVAIYQLGKFALNTWGAPLKEMVEKKIQEVRTPEKEESTEEKTE